MIRDIETARDKVADALWWLRGFSAAAGEADTVPATLAAELIQVREYLDRLQHASVRRLGDEKAVVLTYAEFEHLIDAARPSAAREDLARASNTIRAVLDAYTRETRQAHNDKNPEIPF